MLFRNTSRPVVASKITRAAARGEPRETNKTLLSATKNAFFLSLFLPFSRSPLSLPFRLYIHICIDIFSIPAQEYILVALTYSGYFSKLTQCPHSFINPLRSLSLSLFSLSYFVSPFYFPTKLHAVVCRREKLREECRRRGCA